MSNKVATTNNNKVAVTNRNKQTRNSPTANFIGLRVNIVLSQSGNDNQFTSVFDIKEFEPSTKYVRKAITAVLQNTMLLTGKQAGISKGKRFSVNVSVGEITLLTGTYFHNSGEKAKNKFWREVRGMLNVSLPELSE